MDGFDNPGVFFSNVSGVQDGEEGKQMNLAGIKRKFKDFLKQYHEGNMIYKYRDLLRRQFNIGQFWVEIALEDLSSYDEDLATQVTKYPIESLPLFEEAAKEVGDEVTRPRPAGEEEAKDFQVLITSEGNCVSLRELKSDYISKLVRVSGIVIAASSIRAKATEVAIQCRGCRDVVANIPVRSGLEGFLMPRKCNGDQTGRTLKCPLDPYFIIPDKCKCIDFQTLKLQEAPEAVPQGEMPRHLQVYCDRYLCERVVPGNRVTLVGIYSIKKIASMKTNDRKASIGVRNPYLRVVGIQIQSENYGHRAVIPYTSEEEEYFINLAASSNVYERIVKSIAPSVYGCEDMKKAIACLLFSGSRKRLPDGLNRRGDINVLFLGDPGTAKSQLLKFVEKVAPIAVYTSGKGSSAAGLTASVTRDPTTRNFIMEGGAMVLADGGCVCIDEFDKMREDDRVAIHEAMEQQTISIAKAGITTTLNSRCAVMAAANSVFGRWDDTKADQNIEFMPTILARFDMIFVIKDEHNERKDATLAKHVMDVHMNAQTTIEDNVEGELSLNTLKKYISYCRAKCGPRLSGPAAKKLVDSYVAMRNGGDDPDASRRSTIPITVRQLEAVVRISEALAKMELKPFVEDRHVEEAKRLFKVSTLRAASTGELAGAEGFTSDEDHQTLVKVEKQIKKRFPVGTQISEASIVQDLVQKDISEKVVHKVLNCMIRRGEISYRVSRKMLFRLK
ncbi:DNA replication licensing factor mcm5-B-like [Panonychus citri]|uniref:DNA replication licensing factor mcm5-B-like n=1 Tax=Panonychus citri TaxID=50023 RepID=UPI0023076FB2|nr:DNA replication licensing factor mcm5-B-like [Panonychus citri]